MKIANAKDGYGLCVSEGYGLCVCAKEGWDLKMTNAQQ